MVGVYRMINEFALPGPRCGEADKRPNYLLSVHYLYFALLLAGITVIIVTTVSLLTPAIDRRYLYRLTWWTRYTTAKRLDYEAVSQDHKSRRHQKDPEKYDDPYSTPEINESKLIYSRNINCLHF